jgi:hypothetical protein
MTKLRIAAIAGGVALVVATSAVAVRAGHAEEIVEPIQSPTMPSDPKRVRTVIIRTGKPGQKGTGPLPSRAAPDAPASPNAAPDRTVPAAPNALNDPQRVRTVVIRPDSPDAVATALSPPWPKWLIEPAPAARTSRTPQRRPD